MPGKRCILGTGVLFAWLTTAALTETISGPLSASECFNGQNIKLNLTCEEGVISIQLNETYLGCNQTLCPDTVPCNSSSDCKVLVSDSQHSTGDHWTTLNGCNGQINCQIGVVHSGWGCLKPASNFEVVTYWCVSPETVKPSNGSTTKSNVNQGETDNSSETFTVDLELSTVGDTNGRSTKIQGKTVAIVVVTVFLLILLVVVCIYVCCRKRRGSTERTAEDPEHGDTKESSRREAGPDKLERAFSYISRRTNASYNLYEAVRFSNASAAPPGRYRPSTVRKPEPPPLRTVNETVDETGFGTVHETKPGIAKTADIASDTIDEQINPNGAPHWQGNYKDVVHLPQSVKVSKAKNTGDGDIYEDIDNQENGGDCYANVPGNDDIYAEPIDDTDASVSAKPTASQGGDYDTVDVDKGLYDVADRRVRRPAEASQEGDVIDDDDMILEENDLYSVSDIEASASNIQQTASQDNEVYYETDEATPKTKQLTSQGDGDDVDDDDDDDMVLADNDLYDVAEAIHDPASATGQTGLGLDECGGEDRIVDADDLYDSGGQVSSTEQPVTSHNQFADSVGNTAVQSVSSAIPDTSHDDDDGYDGDDDGDDDDDYDDDYDDDEKNDGNGDDDDDYDDDDEKK